VLEAAGNEAGNIAEFATVMRDPRRDGVRIITWARAVADDFYCKAKCGDGEAGGSAARGTPTRARPRRNATSSVSVVFACQHETRSPA